MSFYYKMIEDGTYCITSYKGNSRHVVFPSNICITVLNDDLFKGHHEIESVEIPETVLQIGGFVFDGCSALKEIHLPQNLEGMWQYAFTRTGIESIVIPGRVKSIIPFTFFQSKSLKTAVLGHGVEKISAWAFKDCTSLNEVYLPSTLNEISEKAFEGCGAINFLNTIDWKAGD